MIASVSLTNKDRCRAADTLSGYWTSRSRLQLLI